MCSSQKRIIEAIEVLGQLLHITGRKDQLYMMQVNYIPVPTKRKETGCHCSANSSFSVIPLDTILYYLVWKIPQNFLNVLPTNLEKIKRKLYNRIN